MTTDVAYVLVLVQVGAGLLAAVGELLFMGSPLYAVMPVLKAGLLILLAVKVTRGRKWALITLLTFEGVSLAGVGLSLAIGLLPVLDRTVTLAGLVTEIVLPLLVAILCALRLAAPPVEVVANR
jgi:hypothetical protein